MAKSRNELIRRVLEVLGVAAAGQPLSAEDTQLVDVQIDSVLANLAGKQIVYVGDSDNIAESVFQDVAVMVADTVSMDFGRPGAMRAPEPDGRSRVDKAEKSLRTVTAGESSGAPQEVVYF